MRSVVEFRWKRSRRRAAGWLAAAFLFLGAQVAVAFHDHGTAEPPSTHRVGSCELCVAHATPAAPPPAPLSAPAGPGAMLTVAAEERPMPVTRAGRTPYSPRAPPAFRPD